MYGRKVGERLRKGTPLHLYLPGPQRGVFNRAAFEASREIIVCESLFDALSFWCAGLQARDELLRRRRLHRRAARGLRRHGTDACTWLSTATRPATRGPRRLAAELRRARHRGVPGAVSQRHGRQRLRAEGARRRPRACAWRCAQRRGWRARGKAPSAKQSATPKRVARSLFAEAARDRSALPAAFEPPPGDAASAPSKRVLERAATSWC